MLRFAPSTENGLPLIWARPRFCEDTFFRLNKEETKKVAGEHIANAKLYEFYKGLKLNIPDPIVFANHVALLDLTIRDYLKIAKI